MDRVEKRGEFYWGSVIFTVKRCNIATAALSKPKQVELKVSMLGTPPRFFSCFWDRSGSHPNNTKSIKEGREKTTDISNIKTYSQLLSPMHLLGTVTDDWVTILHFTLTYMRLTRYGLFFKVGNLVRLWGEFQSQDCFCKIKTELCFCFTWKSSCLAMFNK